jgi:hypothetical protein
MSHLTLLRRNAWIAASSSIISILRIVGCRHYLSNGRRVGYYGIGKAAVCHLEIYRKRGFVPTFRWCPGCGVMPTHER